MTQPILTKQISPDGFVWNLYSFRVATITNVQKHFAPVAYFAFDNYDASHSFWKSITDKRVCHKA